MASLPSIPGASRGAAGRFQLAALVPHATASAMDVRDGQDPTPVGQCLTLEGMGGKATVLCEAQAWRCSRADQATTYFGEESARGHGVPRTKPIVFSLLAPVRTDRPQIKSQAHGRALQAAHDLRPRAGLG
jgi:hypothetical protein